MSMVSPAAKIGAGDLQRRRPGAIIHWPGGAANAVQAAFAEEMKARGWRVGGLVQHTHRDGEGRKTGMELVSLDNGHRFDIAQKLGKGAGNGCTVDARVVADSSSALRRAIAERADLIVVNRFSHLEKSGGGLAAEMLEAISEGLPLLTTVPAEMLGEWMDFCGGYCDLLPPAPDALWRWWGAHRLYRDLALGVADVPARRVVIGLNWTLVEGPDGLGLAQTPDRAAPGCRPLADAGSFIGRSLAGLAALAESWDPFEAALGMAAINAHYNRFDLDGEALNGLDLFRGEPGRTVVIGGFPGIADRLPGCHIVERMPKEPGHYPEQAADWLLPGCDAAVITAATAANGSLPRLLDLAWGARVALVGPGAPLASRLFDYGIEALSGFIAENPDGLARAIAEGGGAREVKRFGRTVSLRRA